MRKVIFSILFIAIFGNMALCQTNRAKWSVGGGLTIVDFGNNFEEKEFNQYYQFKYVDNTASIFVTRSLCRVFDLRGHFGTGRVDFGGQIPRTENYPKAKPYYNGDLSLILKFAKANTENPQIITPYLYGGIGVTNMFFFKGDGCITEPYGLGFLINAGPKVSIMLQSAFTVSTDEAPILEKLYKPNLSPAYENFTQTTIGVTFNLGKTKKEVPEDVKLETAMAEDIAVDSMVAEEAKPADKDNDGVADINDKCPDEKGSVRNNGCPEQQIFTPGNNTITDLPTVTPPVTTTPATPAKATVTTSTTTTPTKATITTTTTTTPTKATITTTTTTEPTKATVTTTTTTEPAKATVTTTTTTTPAKATSSPSNTTKSATSIPAQMPKVQGSTTTASGNNAFGNKTLTNYAFDLVIVENASKKLQFNADNSLTQSSKVQLVKIINIANKYNGSIKVFGHTDNTQADNVSQERANSTAEFISKNGISSSRILETKGFGSSLPIADNNSENKYKNNRIGIIIVQ